MKYTFKELIDVPKLQELTDELYTATSIPSAIVAMDGEILTGSGWQKICTDFHRKHPQIEKECIESDTNIRTKLADGEPFVIYKCPRGLVDASSPIIIDGEHVANVFSGQVFLESRDETTERFFREQARKFGFDEAEYIKAFKKVPIFEEEKFRAGISFLAKLAQSTADNGLTRLRELEAMEALKKTQRLLTDTEKMGKVGGWEFNIHTEKTTWTEEIYHIHEVDLTYNPTVSEAVNFYTPDSKPIIEQAVQQAIEHGEPFDVELEIMTGKGNLRVVHAMGKADLEHHRVYGFFQDITARKRAENKLKQSEENRRLIFENMQDIYYRLDSNGKILEVSPSAVKLYKYNSLDEIIGKQANDFVYNVEDNEKFTEELRRKGHIKSHIIKHKRKNGEPIFVETNTNLIFDNQGNPKGSVGVFRDISERLKADEALRESEMRFRSLFENISDGIYVHDAKGCFLDVNHVACERLGYTREEMLKLTVADVDLDYQTELDVQEKLASAITSGPLTAESRHGTKDGKIIHVELQLSVFLHYGEELFVTIARDITERKQVEEQMKQNLKEKEVLLSEIHHRVKNNMQVISSLLKLQSAKIEDKKYVDLFKDSENRIRSMALIHEKLYQTKDFANIDFSDYVKAVSCHIVTSYRVNPGNIKLKREIEDFPLELDHAIPCGLIINELVSNSLKHAFPKGREGEIKIALRTINDHEVELTVSDDGVGIPREIDMGNPETLGLELVQILAENQLDGTLEFERDGGTEFRIRFKK